MLVWQCSSSDAAYTAPQEEQAARVSARWATYSGAREKPYTAAVTSVSEADLGA